MTLLDSAQIDTNSAEYSTHNDTTVIFTRNGTPALTSGYDYEIFFPSISVLVEISDIDEQKEEGNCPDKVQCVDPVNSYKINGSLITKENPYDDMIYIQK